MADVRPSMSQMIFRLVLLFVVLFHALWLLCAILLWSVQEVFGLEGYFTFGRALGLGVLTWLYLVARLWTRFQDSKVDGRTM